MLVKTNPDLLAKANSTEIIIHHIRHPATFIITQAKLLVQSVRV
jgi:hypothetical protein